MIFQLTLKGFKGFTAGLFIQAYGYDSFLRFVETKAPNRGVKNRLKQMVKDIAVKTSYNADKDALITELDDKINFQLNELRA